MSSPTLAQLVDVAVAAAKAGGDASLKWFQRDLKVDFKADGSPVTEADREAEDAVRRIISGAFPGHDILGEERGATDLGAEYRWIIDPIDGTKSFVQGVPLYSTLVAVEHRGDPIVGIVNLPALGELVVAARGQGCTWNGSPCRVSQTQALDAACVCVTDVSASRARGPGWDRLAGASRIQRTWGDSYGYVMVATGRAEVALDHAMSPWDCAAVMVVVEEAGGRFTSWRGQRTIDGGDSVATNGLIHDEVVALLEG